MAGESQFRLLRERRFLPFFGTQALGAFNDNVYKNALVIIATYHAAEFTSIKPALLTNLAGALFILPFVLFAGLAGQLSDKFDKVLVLRVVKACEVGIMMLAGIGFEERNFQADHLHPSAAVQPQLLEGPAPASPDPGLAIRPTVTCRILVDEAGTVREARIFRSRLDLARFEDVAIDAVKKYRFTPGKKAGNPAAVWINWPVSFK